MQEGKRENKWKMIFVIGVWVHGDMSCIIVEGWIWILRLTKKKEIE
jgi:hypothetical protein